jgi:peptidoglycan hydrolase CwlO-like protein
MVLRMKQLTKWVAPAALVVVGMVAPSAMAEDAPAAPNLDTVLSDLAKIGPDQLIAHVDALKKQIGDLKAESEAAQKKAAELEAQSTAVKAQVETIEKFIASVQTAMAPPAPAPAPAEPAPAPAPAEPAPAPAPAPEAAPAPAPAE